MTIEILTQDAGTMAPFHTDRVFLVVHIDGGGSRIVDLPLDIDVTFGRSRGATIVFDHEKISRLHARIRRSATGIVIEDLTSRNGTRVNGERITGVRALRGGDEIVIGPIVAVVGETSRLRRGTHVLDGDALEQRLVAEVDRSMRYRRPLAIASIRIADDTISDAIASAIRPMDVIGEDVGDDFLIVLPELDRATASSTLERIARDVGLEARWALAIAPEDGTTVETLVARLRQLRRGRPVEAPPPERDGRIVVAPAMQRVYALAERIADSAMTVLVVGETGTGKELVTEAIHRASGRRAKPLIKLNCAALTETLLESSLFGHERGAFTGADRRTIGFFEAADGGTLFLDEIGELSPGLQAKLLRVLERKVITRVGGTAEIAVDTRVVAATHRDLDTDVREGRFRQDLHFRISGFTIAVPPLRDRTDEILPLAEHFTALAARESNRAVPAIAPDARDALVGYAWPGNVRELRNAIDRAVVLCTDTIILADLPDRLLDGLRRTTPIATAGADMRGQLADVERAAIVAALDEEAGNQTRAARRLGLSRRSLIYKMEKYGLKPPPPAR